MAGLAQGMDRNEAIQIAAASGHGVGKSTLVAWIILWAISTFEDTRGVVTANTETQLKTKTWAELGKWHRLFMGSHLFFWPSKTTMGPHSDQAAGVPMDQGRPL